MIRFIENNPKRIHRHRKNHSNTVIKAPHTMITIQDGNDGLAKGNYSRLDNPSKKLQKMEK